VCQASDGLGAVGRDFHVEAIFAEHLRQTSRCARVVIDEQ
jgi:hypothetical protein